MRIPQATIDRYFRLAIFVKGIDGVLEMLGGIILLFIPLSTIHGILATLTTHEVAEDPHAFIAHFVMNLDRRITPGYELIAALYLLIHGAIKLILAHALLKRKYHYFPIAIAFLLIFLFYGVYLVGLNHSVSLGLLCVFDTAVIWLTYMEYQRHRVR
jgi:uncharacterized membrane protein